MSTSSKNVTLVMVASLIVVGAIAWWLTRPSYGEISHTGYDYAMALYSACNGKSTAKVQQISTMIDEAESAGELTLQEKAWLQGIARQALDGDWNSANSAVRRLMEEQTRDADLLPKID